MLSCSIKMACQLFLVNGLAFGFFSTSAYAESRNAEFSEAAIVRSGELAVGQANLFPEAASYVTITLSGKGIADNPFSVTADALDQDPCPLITMSWVFTLPKPTGRFFSLRLGIQPSSSAGSLGFTSMNSTADNSGSLTKRLCLTSDPAELGIYPSSAGGTRAEANFSRPIDVTTDESRCAPKLENVQVGETVWRSPSWVKLDDYNSVSAAYVPKLSRHISVVRKGDYSPCEGYPEEWFSINRSGPASGYVVVTGNTCGNFSDRCEFIFNGNSTNVKAGSKPVLKSCDKIMEVPKEMAGLCLPIPNKIGRYAVLTVGHSVDVSHKAAAPRWVCTNGSQITACHWEYDHGFTIKGGNFSSQFFVNVKSNSVTIAR